MHKTAHCQLLVDMAIHPLATRALVSALFSPLILQSDLHYTVGIIVGLRF